jgi:predicted component of viral defense system (DUF524 family)
MIDQSLPDATAAADPCPFICIGQGRQALAILDHLQVTLAPASWILYEWTLYRASFPGADQLRIGSTILDADLITEQDVGQVGHFRIVFENQLGLTTIVPYRDDHPSGEPIRVEVIAGKFPNADHSVEFLLTTLADLFARGSALPFVTNATTNRGIRDAFQAPNNLFAFHFFRHRDQELLRAVQAVLGKPHRILADQPEMVRIHEVKRIESESLIRMLQGTARADTGPIPQTGTPLERLRPERVLQRLPVESYDTPENRFIVTAARRMLAAIEHIKRTKWFRSAQVADIDRGRLRSIHQHLRQLTTDPRFAMLERSVRFPAQSRVLQRRDGYREMALLWQAFHRTREPVFEAMEHAIDLRDVATLYEYWLLFELIDQITLHTGIRPSLVKAFDELGHPTSSFEARFHGAGSLYYQRGFRSPHVYSGISLYPDYVWETGDGKRIVMDAKFRIQYPWPKEGEENDKDLGQASAKTDDITKMHAYRDAIAGVTAAIVLYPGVNSSFRTTNGESLDITIDDIIQGDLNGIGAIAMSPIRVANEVEGTES